MVYIGADHRGYRLKDIIFNQLIEWGYEVRDLNSSYDKDDDYVDMAIKVAEKVVFEKGLGILICGSGNGMAMSANKVAGIRAAVCMNEKQARLAKEDTNANILCLSGELTDKETNLEIVKTFIETVFSSEERYIRRINKIKKYENLKVC